MWTGKRTLWFFEKYVSVRTKHSIFTLFWLWFRSLQMEILEILSVKYKIFVGNVSKPCHMWPFASIKIACILIFLLQYTLLSVFKKIKINSFSLTFIYASLLHKVLSFFLQSIYWFILRDNEGNYWKRIWTSGLLRASIHLQTYSLALTTKSNKKRKEYFLLLHIRSSLEGKSTAT